MKRLGEIRSHIVLGNSRGLGYHLTDGLLRRNFKVIGVARSGIEQIRNHLAWTSTGQYSHLTLDVGKEESIELLRAACGELPEGPIGVIYNAACTKEDIEDGLRIRPDILGEINRAGISGLANTLQAFEGALLERGGLLTGISSFSALVPPATRGKLAYPATKAYMDMIMRTLGFLWKDRVRVLTIHLGLMKEEAPGSLPGRMLISTYQEAAERIIRAITSGRIPSELNYPWIYNVAYSGFLKHLPDFLYFPIMRGVSEVGPESKDRVQ